jgi:hypothetical protein
MRKREAEQDQPSRGLCPSTLRHIAPHQRYAIYKLRAHNLSGPQLRLKAPSAKVRFHELELRPFGRTGLLVPFFLARMEFGAKLISASGEAV